MIERKWPGGRRISDWQILLGLVVASGTVVGMCIKLFAYPVGWENTKDRVAAMEPELLKVEARQTLTEQEITEMRGDMKALLIQVTDIKENVHYIRQHGS